MIDDPIVIRKSRGALVVSSSILTDPIQLVREIARDKLEVHLKNGSKYIEELNGADIQEIILEMMGYGIVQITFGFTAWPRYQEGTLSFVEDQKTLAAIGKDIVNEIFTETPYMNSKFLSLRIDSINETPNIKFYDTTYSRYDIEATIHFRARVDFRDKIIEQFESIWHDASKLFANEDAGTGDLWLKVHITE